MGQVCPYKCKSGRVFNTVTGTWQQCPHCTGVLQELGSVKTADDSKTDLLERLKILPELRDAKFDPETFFEPTAYEIFAPQTFKPVLEKLTQLELGLIDGKVLRESCYFYVGLYANIEAYVSSCLRHAVLSGITAVPYTSLVELQGIRDGVKQMSRIYENISYYDYMTSDICFLYTSASSGQSEACVLAEILAERSRHGLPTYVFGYWADYALSNNHSPIHFMISNGSKRLGLLHSYEIMTKSRYANTDAGQAAGETLETLGTISPGTGTGVGNRANAGTGAISGTGLDKSRTPSTLGTISMGTPSMVQIIESQSQEYIKSRNIGGVSPIKYNEGAST